MNNYRQATLFEHRFWLQILKDHSRFIFNALSSKEDEEIQQARNFINTFDSLLEQTRGQPQLIELTQQANQYAEDIRQFKLDLLRQHLVGEIIIDLPPSFINHMVNEVEEYLRILDFLLVDQVPDDLHPIHHHLLWLLDAKGHAGAINDSLDLTEQDLKEKSRSFEMQFDDYYDKAVEMKGYLRTCLDNFPALRRFNQQVEAEMNDFMDFLQKLRELEINNQLLGTLTPLLPDHMFREECYYLIKLAQVSELNRPNCNPIRPGGNID